MKKVALVVALLALVALTASSALAQGISGGSQNVGIVTLNAQNGSGEDGSATLSEENGKVTVTIKVSNGTSAPQPAHIHRGTCATLDPKPTYPLTSVVNGESVTTLDVSLATLMSEPYAINIHKSATEASTYVSCGDLTTMARAGGTNPGAGGGTSGGETGGTVGMPATGSGDQPLVLAALALLGAGMVATGLKLARRTR